MSFDAVQDQIVELLSDNEEQQFIFLTGAAGTGKTTLLERIKNQLSSKKIVVAPTGIAALNIGGTTINSAFRIGFDTIPVITKSKDPRFAKLLKNLKLEHKIVSSKTWKKDCEWAITKSKKNSSVALIIKRETVE